MKDIIISSTTDEVTTDSILIYHRHGYIESNVPVTVWAWGLGAGEEVTIQFPTDNASTWIDVHSITPDGKTVTIYAPVEFRVYKQATANPVGVAMSKVRGV